MSEVRVAALVGSLRKDSLNRKLYNAAGKLAPPDMAITEIKGWDHWPIFNADSVQDDGFPQAVKQAAHEIEGADAILIVSPEYNYSVPGGLKNTIDWLSRVQPPVFADKAVAIMGASGGPVGTARMQYHLRQMLVFLDAHPVNKPEVMLGRANEAFDSRGELTNEVTATLVGQLLANLAIHAGRFTS